MTIFSNKKDKLLGIPLLFTLGGFSGERFSTFNGKINSAGFLRIGSPKDIIASTDFFEKFKCKYPDCKVTLFTDIVDFYPPISQIDTVIKFDGRNINKNAAIISASGVFDLWVDLGVWSRFEAVLSLKAKANYKIGFRTQGEMRHFAYDRVANYDRSIHFTDNLTKLAALVGVKFNTDVSKVRKKTNVDPKSIVINMFPDVDKHKNRMWSFINWKNLTENLSKKGYRISIIGDKSYSSLADKFVESLSAEADVDYLVGRIDSEGVWNLLIKSALLVSIDATPIYIALRAGVPVVGLFAPTYPIGNFFTGYDKLNESVTSNHPCIGCQNKYGDEDCFQKKTDCMDSILWKDVEQRILKICENRGL